MDKERAEAITKVVYGETFARYTAEEFEQFLRPLELRLEANGISPDVFKAKRCLDAGCGGGRGTVLMARADADDVVAFDFAGQNVQTTRETAKRLGLSNVTTQRGSLLELPFADESFDIVWCNGVIHHTVDPDRALCEVARVLRPGGHMWLYVYGAGGIYWCLVDFLRQWLCDVDMHTTMFHLAFLDTPTGRIAEFIDDWYVPNLKRYTHEDIVARLTEVGMGQARRLEAGMPYDTSVRRRHAGQRRWMGEGDLRYWATKTGRPTGDSDHILPDVNGLGSHDRNEPCVTAFEERFEALAKAQDAFAHAHPNLACMSRVATAARLQTWLRDTLSAEQPFDGETFHREIRRRAEFLRQTGQEECGHSDD